MSEVLNQDYLYTHSGTKVFLAKELDDGDYLIENLAGQRYWNVESKMMTRSAYERLKANHNLYLEYELNTQKTIFDL